MVSDGKTKRSVQDDEETDPVTRKRVTKTRMVQKKKTIRVKDKKGYRVSKDVVEEVEETYTDWESEPEPASASGPRKKPRKTSEESSKNNKKEIVGEAKSKTSPDTKTKSVGIARSDSNLNARAASTSNNKKEGIKKSTSKDQSNITRCAPFFRSVRLSAARESTDACRTDVS